MYFGEREREREREKIWSKLKIRYKKIKIIQKFAHEVINHSHSYYDTIALTLFQVSPWDDLVQVVSVVGDITCIY